jgi:hypothetical protein
MRKALFGSMMAAAILTGCATLQAGATRSTEEMLSAAGFSIEAADTEQTIDLQTPPARRVLREVRDGKAVYVYRDPTVCRCVYVGGEPEYQQYQRLRLQKDVADEQRSPDPNGGWGWAWGPWGGWAPSTQWR